MAFIADRCEPFYDGGYEHHLWELARRLALRHEVKILTSIPQPQAHRDGVSFERISPFLSYVRRGGGHSLVQACIFATCSAAFMRTANKYDFLDVLAIPYAQMPLVRIRQSLGKWRWGLTVWEAWWHHAYLNRSLRIASRSLFRTLLRLSVVGSHKVIVGSRNAKEALLAYYGVCPSRVEVVSPGVDRELIDTAPPSPSEVDVAFMGRLDGYKRVHDLLASIRHLKERSLRIKTCIIGEGAHLESLRELATELGIGDIVSFCGRLPILDAYSILKSTKVFVMPSEREGFSIATLEAMACGAVPVVAVPHTRDAFGVSDVVLNNLSGFWYPVGDTVALADRIERLLADDSLRARMAGAALQTSTLYGWDRTLRAYESQVLGVSQHSAE